MVQYKHKPTNSTFIKCSINFIYYYIPTFEDINNPITKIPECIVESGQDWEKVEEILLITENRVGIKKGEWVYSVRTQYKNWETTETLITKKDQVTNDFGWKHFSSKEVRENFMGWNQPRFSLVEVMRELKKWNTVIPDDVLYAIEGRLNHLK